MRVSRWLWGIALVLLWAPAVAQDRTPLPVSATSVLERFENFRVAQARTCKAVSSCEEAVRLWCGGYRRADGDNDGIPCENVCGSLREVEEIKERIGC